MTQNIGKKNETPRQSMPEQDPGMRRRNFDEVPLGYTVALAQEEAGRCLQCKKPNCAAGCPVEVDIPGFINLITRGDFTGAIRNLWGKKSLPYLKNITGEIVNPYKIIIK